MKKILLISFAIVVLLAILFYSLVLLGVIRDPFAVRKEQDVPKELHTTIEIGQSTYVERMQEIAIEGTDDWFIITSEGNSHQSDISDDEHPLMEDFVLVIPYTFHVDGVDYSGLYERPGGYREEHQNPKYRLKVVSYTSLDEIAVLITEKH